MKTFKLLLLLALVSFSSCSKDDDSVAPADTITFSITYDSALNLISIDGGTFVESFDAATYVDEYNFSPAAAEFGALESWENKKIIVVSDGYELLSATVEDIYTGYSIQNGNLVIDVPTLRDYIIAGNTYFYFNVQVSVN